MTNTWKRDLGAVCCVVAAYAVLFALGVTCPIKFVTGVSCPGCGMTRAWLSLLRLDLGAAWGYHPLFWLPPVALAAYFLCRRPFPRALRLGVAAVCALFCVVYLIRLLGGYAPDVVVCSPREGLLYRLVSLLRSGS